MILLDHVFSSCYYFLAILLLHHGIAYLKSASRLIIYKLMFLIEHVVDEIQVWKFFVTFGDVLGLPSFTLDEFVQALHDYVSSRYSISC